MENNNVKVTSLRLNEEDVAKFKQFALDNNINQQQAFSSLIGMLELENAKNTLSDRAKEIEVFKDTVNKLIGFYVNSLEVNVTTEERIREDLQKELKTKDNIILNLQSQLSDEKEEVKLKNKEISNLTSKIAIYDEKLLKINKQLEDKEKQIDLLNKNNTIIQEQLSELKDYKKENKEFANYINELQDNIKELNKENIHLKNDNEILKNKIISNEEVLNFYKEQINELKDTIRDLSNSIITKEVEYKEKIKILEDEKTKEINSIKSINESNISTLEAKLMLELSKKDLEIEKLKGKLEK